MLKPDGTRETAAEAAAGMDRPPSTAMLVLGSVLMGLLLLELTGVLLVLTEFVD